MWKLRQGTTTVKNPLLSAVLKSKYFHSSSFWLIAILDQGPFSSYLSCRLKKDLCTNTFFFQIHAGNTSIWSTPWCPVWESIHDHLLLPVTTRPLPATAFDLWLPNSHTWNLHLLTNTFDNLAVQDIASVRPVPSDEQDILLWTPAKNGICTTKEIYRQSPCGTSGRLKMTNFSTRKLGPLCMYTMQQLPI